VGCRMQRTERYLGELGTRQNSGGRRKWFGRSVWPRYRLLNPNIATNHESPQTSSCLALSRASASAPPSGSFSFPRAEGSNRSSAHAITLDSGQQYSMESKCFMTGGGPPGNGTRIITLQVSDTTRRTLRAAYSPIRRRRTLPTGGFLTTYPPISPATSDAVKSACGRNVDL